MFLNVWPIEGIVRFGQSGKLNPRYIRPYRVLERVGVGAYQLTLSPKLAVVHNVFYISILRPYVPDPAHVLMQAPIIL